MKRNVEHAARPNNACSCGAKFKSAAKLRKHLAGGEPRDVWIGTPNPTNPHRQRRR